MGQSVATLAELPPETRAQVRAFMDQVIIALVKRAGGRLEMPAAEVDATGDSVLGFEVVPAPSGRPEDGTFVFQIKPKA